MVTRRAVPVAVRNQAYARGKRPPKKVRFEIPVRRSGLELGV